MIILKDGDNRNDVLGLTNDDLKIIEMGLKGLIENDNNVNPNRIWQLIRSLNNDLAFFDTNTDSVPMYRKNGDDCFKTVDLGLPSGLLWATCNVGATSPEQAGLYFAWGETQGISVEQIARGERKFNKTSYKAKIIKTDLTLEQDAARANLGGNWRMPTEDDFEELIENCTFTWTDDYNGTGVAGYVITSKTNENSIFLPAAGYCNGSSASGVGSYGYYWSASWDLSSYAWHLGFYFGDAYMTNGSRFCGFSVRGVCERL